MRHPRVIRLVEEAPSVPLAMPIKGRGAVEHTPHRFERVERDEVDDGWGTLEQSAQEEHLPPETRIIEEQVKSIL